MIPHDAGGDGTPQDARPDDHSASRNVNAILLDAPHLLEDVTDAAGRLHVREAEWRITGEPILDNSRRARAGLLALLTFPYRDDDLTDRDVLEEAIGDLICDLLHLAQSREIDTGIVTERALRHWREEVRDAERWEEAHAGDLGLGKRPSTA